MTLDEKKLKETIDVFMENYDKKMEIKRAVDEDDNDPEENDGWTTVSSKKKRGQFAPQRKESTINKITTTEERKNKRKELVNFYPFQKRAKQMESKYTQFYFTLKNKILINQFLFLKISLQLFINISNKLY